jgi:hypothetical protein
MAARSSARPSARTSAARRRTSRSRGRGRKAFIRIEEQLPPTLREYAAEIRKRLDRLEREIARARVEARRRAARVLRDASQQLGRLEVGGEAGWRRLGASYQKDLISLLRRLEKTLAPRAAGSARRSPKKRAARKASASAAEAGE